MYGKAFAQQIFIIETQKQNEKPLCFQYAIHFIILSKSNYERLTQKRLKCIYQICYNYTWKNRPDGTKIHIPEVYDEARKMEKKYIVFKIFLLRSELKLNKTYEHALN